MYIGWILFGAIAVLSFAVQSSLSNKFAKYSRIPLSSALAGRDVAIRMLAENGIRDVNVTCVPGNLTDHFNPSNKTVNLSDSVYATNSIAAAAVAAHECGHAVQHATGYAPLSLRTSLVPMVSFASRYMSWVLLIGIALLQLTPIPFWIGIALFAATTLFSLVTLPVEIDASRRAIAWLEKSGITQGQATDYAKDALRAAAYTYVVAALGSLATLVYYIMMGRRSS